VPVVAIDDDYERSAIQGTRHWATAAWAIDTEHLAASVGELEQWAAEPDSALLLWAFERDASRCYLVDYGRMEAGRSPVAWKAELAARHESDPRTLIAGTRKRWIDFWLGKGEIVAWIRRETGQAGTFGK